MALVQFCNCIQMVTGCDLKNISIHMVYMCISVDAYAEYNVQASSAGDLCIHALLFSDTVVSFRCEEMLQI